MKTVLLRFHWVILMTTITAISSSALSSIVNPNNSSDVCRTCNDVSNYPPGDQRLCLETARKNGDDLQRFEVLPGFGWDNLRNINEGQVLQFNFSQCRTTDDGRFLLPDSVSAEPVKSSRVQIFAELIEDWKTWTSLNAKSVNIDAGLSTGSVSVSGKFSADFEETKSKQIGDQSITTRAQVRYVRYAVRLQPDTPLHPTFRNRLLDIAAALELNQTEQARYLCQLLVRDFGTHVITGADAGAALGQVDNIREQWVKEQIERKSDILASASLSLFSVFHMSASYETKTDSKFVDDYHRSRTSSSILTYGGTLFKPANFTPDMWASSVDSDLVALDRTGDPLYYLITEAVLPELPSSTLAQLGQFVTEAIDAYYKYNTIRGCLDPNAPNFYPAANVDDGTCHPANTNLTFGGMFQTCISIQSSNGDLCAGMSQVNPSKGDYSCSTEYQPVLLYEGSLTSSRTQHNCHSCWLFFRCCSDDYYASYATYKLFWCAATGPVHQASGYLFGGLYTSKVANPVTQTLTCPPNFFALKVGHQADLRVCISDDYELGRPFSVPFAGFHSCQAGNPLAMSSDSKANTLRNAVQESQTGHLRMFFQNKVSDWPQRCPDGYSQHLATIDQGCQINYCLRAGALSGPVLPPVKRPPFMPPPNPPAPFEKNQVIFDPSTRTWNKNQKAKELTSAMAAKQGMEERTTSSNTLTPGSAAGIAVSATTMACLLVGFLVFLVVRSKRNQRRQEYINLGSSSEDRLVDYGSAGDVYYSRAEGNEEVSVGIQQP